MNAAQQITRSRNSKGPHPGRGWIFLQISGSLSVGLETRTWNTRNPTKDHALDWRRGLRRRHPRFALRTTDALGGAAPTRPILAGGERAVQRGNP